MCTNFSHGYKSTFKAIIIVNKLKKNLHLIICTHAFCINLYLVTQCRRKKTFSKKNEESPAPKTTYAAFYFFGIASFIAK
jgi:hypothetical protein